MYIRFAELLFYVIASSFTLLLLVLLSRYFRSRNVGVYCKIIRLITLLALFITLPAQWFLVERVKMFLNEKTFDSTSIVLWSFGVIAPLVFIYSNKPHFLKSAEEKNDKC